MNGRHCLYGGKFTDDDLGECVSGVCNNADRCRWLDEPCPWSRCVYAEAPDAEGLRAEPHPR